jgi:hypothetical protein
MDIFKRLSAPWHVRLRGGREKRGGEEGEEGEEYKEHEGVSFASFQMESLSPAGEGLVPGSCVVDSLSEEDSPFLQHARNHSVVHCTLVWFTA